MNYRVRIDRIAQCQIDHFARYLRKYSQDFAIEQIERLDRILFANVAQSPLTWGYFPLTGAPYRAYLFHIGRRTQYWIVYTVDEDKHIVDVLSFWNTARDPAMVEL
jgi:mRNA-degrading endonuclease RelE of RelBE toxin-antitoxin system